MQSSNSGTSPPTERQSLVANGASAAPSRSAFVTYGAMQDHIARVQQTVRRGLQDHEKQLHQHTSIGVDDSTGSETGTRDSLDSTHSDGRRGERRSMVAHALLRRASDSETTSSARVEIAIRVSLIINVILATAKTYAVFASGSLAVLSSLVDSILDLTSQWLFWYSDKRMHTPNINYPAGQRRLEPVAVVISATLMGMAAIEVVQKSVETLVVGFNGTLPDLDMTRFTICVLVFAIGIKIVLWIICSRIGQTSPSAAALAQDHRNDVFSNVVAVTTSMIAHWHRDLWYADSIGAIFISIYIAYSWLETGKEQVERLIGLRATPDFVEQVREISDLHHPQMTTDIVRAYHFGSNYLVEIEVILPANMCVRDAHDISLALQTKVEELDNVERAFVHVDYLSRDYDEHKDPTLRRETELTCASQHNKNKNNKGSSSASCDSSTLSEGGSRESLDSSASDGNRGERRSLIAHSLLRHRSDLEAQDLHPVASARVELAIRLSVCVNVILATAQSYAVFASGSLAVLSSLVDSILDLTSQWLFWYSDKRMHTPNINYPAGQRRLEPVAVVISATLMGMAAIEVLQKSVETLVVGFNGTLPDTSELYASGLVRVES